MKSVEGVTDGHQLEPAWWGVEVLSWRQDRPDMAGVSGGRLLSSQWWVKPVRCTGKATGSGRVKGTGFSGVLGPAPPVYDPGGPVLLADHLDPAVELETFEREAASLGAVLVVLPTPPGDQREQQLRRRSWTVASQWFVGQPHDASS